MKILNADLRLKIVEIIKNSGEGHIPSSFSIIDIVNFIYENILKVYPDNFNTNNKDYFILSKGHAAAALFVVLNKFKFIDDSTLNN